MLRDELIASGLHKFPELKKTFNPWSPEIVEQVKRRCLSSERTIDNWLTCIYGTNYLQVLSRKTFPSYWKEIENFQLTAMMNESTESSDEPWSDVLEKFYYDGADIPVARVPVGSKVNVKITNFEDLHRWTGYIVDEPWKSYRDRLQKMLDDFCLSVSPPDKFIPQKDQICLVKVPTWSQIDETMTGVKKNVGEQWKPYIWRRTDREVEDKIQAGHWYRGVTLSPSVDWEYGSTWSECHTFWLPDVSRTVPVHKDFILPAPFRFVAVPKLGISGNLLLQSKLLRIFGKCLNIRN